MSTRLYYLRDQKNIQTRPDGSKTRGNPLACVASTIDRTTGVIKYAVSSSHPKDRFERPLARKIAMGRLNAKPIELQGCPLSGHQITHRIMEHIERTTTAATLRMLAGEWLARASIHRAQPEAVIIEPAPQRRYAE